MGSMNLDWMFIADRLLIHVLPSILWAIGLFLYAARDIDDWKKKLTPLFIYGILMVSDKFFHIFYGIPIYRFLSLFAMFAWFLILNYKNIGLSLFAFGGIFNAAVSIINNGKMPVMGKFEVTEIHQPMTENTIFSFLADWIPSPYGFYQVSMGDIFLGIGGLIFFGQELWLLFRKLRGSKK